MKRMICGKLVFKVNLIIGMLCCVFGMPVSGQSMNDYVSVPSSALDSTTPLVMLVMSQDNPLWHKAYNDYSDLDGDGSLDTTYDDRISYYGYFVSNQCYTYSTINRRFAPSTDVILVDDSDVQLSHRCSGAWSGNFLNWLTTTRIDVVRKVLYGGYRYQTLDSGSILQRALIPSDNHAFVKLVSNKTLPVGSISDFTPISGKEELSFCNVTDVSASDDSLATADYLSGDIDAATNPPLLKIAAGLWPTWAGSEVSQCQFRTGNDEEERGSYEYSAPRSSTAIVTGVSDSEMVVRVETCVSTEQQANSDLCREYGEGEQNTYYKPYGLLQTYGETGLFKFGLLTGSYNNNHDGGVVRKNIAFMGGDAAEGDEEINRDNGEFIERTSGRGIINTLNRLRVAGWSYRLRDYLDCASAGISVESFLLDNTNTECKDWGNPLSEMYLEALRYFAGGSPTDAYAAGNEESIVRGGLSSESDWTDPFSSDEPCSQCSILLISTGLNSFDGDQLGSFDDLPGIDPAGILESNQRSLAEYTDVVGSNEGINGGDYIVGNAGSGSGGTAGECDTKSDIDLSEVSGICPEIPTLQGSFNIAGAAYYAHQNDLRDDLDGLQNVKTYAVSLAESLPSFEIPVGNNSVTLVPTCRSHSQDDTEPVPQGTRDPWRECSLVDLTVGAQDDNYGRYTISWEDSPWGNDYDFDAYSVIEYCTASGTKAQVQQACPNFTEQENSAYEDNAPDSNTYDYSRHDNMPEWTSAQSGQIQVRVAMIGASAGFAMKFGYTMNGALSSSSTDGTSGNGAFVDEILRYGGYDGNSTALTGERKDYVIWSADARKFAAAESTPGRLNNPLWYAAKYGNFNDLNGDNVPRASYEWDLLNIDGSMTDDDADGVGDGDGIPDTYFPVKNPAFLSDALTSIFENINGRIASGSAAAVNAQTGRGEGIIVQAVYTPTLEEDGSRVSWFGELRGFFIDRLGQIREDRPVEGEPHGNGRLDQNDRILQFSFNETANETQVEAFEVDDNDERLSSEGTVFSLSSDQINPIWSAQEQMNSLSELSSLIALNRDYSDSSGTQRYIFTAFDKNNDGQVIMPASSASADTAVAFTDSNFTLAAADENADNYRYLGLDNPAQSDVDNLINFIRGDENINGFRSRTLGDKRYLLGDIVNSTPASVSKPADRYDLRYQDDTYLAYYDAYINRRNVVYVGANDGMLHAYNAGFFDSSDLSFDAGEYPLGSELWAYVPFNLLPHLQWLTSPQYQHVSYVDGEVKSYDVKIFDPSDTHVEGWGTIIVASMRFGGGDFALDHDGNAATEQIVTRSAHIIMDVTNPESPPTLIAEITDDQLGYTTASPTLVKSVTNSGDRWYLVFGSGPYGNDDLSRREALDKATSNQAPRIYAFDLEREELVLETQVTSSPESFVGGLASSDWTGSYQDDAIYFGTVSGTPEAPAGNLKRGRLTFSGAGLSDIAIDNLYSGSDLAFSAPPLTHRENNNYWVFAGTGRFYVAEDNESDQQQYFFGIKEPVDSSGFPSLTTTVNDRSLVDTTEIDVFTDGRVFNNRSGTQAAQLEGGQEPAPDAGDLTPPDSSPETFRDIQEYIAVNGGWKFAFRNPLDPDNTAPDSNASRIRNTTRAAIAGNSLVITAYQGTQEICDTDGRGFLYAPHVTAGVPGPFAPLATDENDRIPSLEGSSEPDEVRVLSGVDIGVGFPSEPVVLKPAGAIDPDRRCQPSVVYTQGGKADIRTTEIDCETLPAGRKGWREIPVSW